MKHPHATTPPAIPNAAAPTSNDLTVNVDPALPTPTKHKRRRSRRAAKRQNARNQRHEKTLQQPPPPGTTLILCPYCGCTQAVSPACVECKRGFGPNDRLRAQVEMGPWQVRDRRNLFLPGYCLEQLLTLTRDGRITPNTPLRGPTTRQFWLLARDVPGVSHHVGFCHKCKRPVKKSKALQTCPHCAADFVASNQRDRLNLLFAKRAQAEAAALALDQRAEKGDERPPTLDLDAVHHGTPSGAPTDAPTDAPSSEINPTPSAPKTAHDFAAETAWHSDTMVPLDGGLDDNNLLSKVLEELGDLGHTTALGMQPPETTPPKNKKPPSPPMLNHGLSPVATDEAQWGLAPQPGELPTTEQDNANISASANNDAPAITWPTHAPAPAPIGAEDTSPLPQGATARNAPNLKPLVWGLIALNVAVAVVAALWLSR